MRGPRVVFRSSILSSEWSCRGRDHSKVRVFGRTIRLVCRRGTVGAAVWTPRPPLAAFCCAKTGSVKSTSLWSTRVSQKGCGLRAAADDQAFKQRAAATPAGASGPRGPTFDPEPALARSRPETGWRSLRPPKSPAGQGNQRKSARQCPAPPARQRSRLKGAVLATRSRDRTESPREGNRPGARARPPRRARGPVGRSNLTPRPPRIPQVHR